MDQLQLIKKMKSHHLGVRLAPREIEIPEWDLKIYIQRVTLGERDLIHQATRISTHQGMFMTLVQRAKDKDGHRIFSEGLHDEFFESVGPDPTVFDRIVHEINHGKEKVQKDSDEESDPTISNSSKPSMT
ncbi:MAG: hypothetical protein GY835_05725 [bacterium]|nr:hypothetical protein [bacterium]